jgi:hypothetical protein
MTTCKVDQSQSPNSIIIPMIIFFFKYQIILYLNLIKYSKLMCFNFYILKLINLKKFKHIKRNI